MRIGPTDRSVFFFFLRVAPFVLFLNVLSFQTKNVIGGIGTNLFVLFFAIVLSMALLRKKRCESGLVLLIAIIVFIFVKNMMRGISGAGAAELMTSIRNYSFFAVYYYLGLTYLDSEKARSEALRSISFFVMISALIGVVHYHFFYKIPFIDLNYATDAYGSVLYLKDYDLMRFRESSIFFGPNVFAYMLVFGYICFFQQWLTDRELSPSMPNWRIVAPTLLIAYALITTDSRSALFLLFIFIWINVVKRDSGLLLRFAVPVVIVMIAAALLIFSERFSLSLAASDPRFLKLFVAYTLLNMSSLNWVIGLPMGSAWDAGDVPFSDNLYAALLLEGGAVLVFLLFVFILALNRKIKFSSPNISSSDARFLVAAKFSLVFFLFYGLFAIPTSMINLFNYLGLLLGGVARIAIQNRSERHVENI